MTYISGGMVAAIASRWAPIICLATLLMVACIPGEKTPTSATHPPSETIEATTTPVASSIPAPTPSQKSSLFPTPTPVLISTPVLASTPVNPPSPTPVTPVELTDGTLEIDSIPPIVLGFSPEDGSILNEVQTTIIVTFIDQGGSGIDPTGVVVTLDGIAVEGATTILEGNTATFTFVSEAGLAEGIHRVTAEAMDLAGNKGTAATTTFTIDLTPPTATIAISPPQSNRADKVITIEFHDDLTGVDPATIVVNLDGVTVESNTPILEGNTVTFSLASEAGLAEGIHRVTAEATDLAGNAGTAVTVTFMIDLTPPTATIAISPPQSNRASKVITIEFQDVLTGVDPATIVVNLDGVTVESPMLILEGNTVTFSFASETRLAEGIHRVTAEATDLAGNKGPAITAAFLVDITSPTVSISVLPGDRNRATKTVTIQFSDKLSGVSFSTRKITLNGVDRTQDGEFSGNSWTLVELLKRQSHVIEVQVQDIVGNIKRKLKAFDIISTPPDFKVAFIGDQSLSVGAKAVLQLIKDEGVQMVIHSGDFDYADNPDAWDQQIDDILGPGFPYFASVGNHDILDESAWPAYQAKLQARLDLIEDAVCTGDLGVKSACHYQGLFFILSGAGTVDTGHDLYIKDQLANDDSTWRICSWHKTQNLMQVQVKTDEVGWPPYEECRKGGAIVATAHLHNYQRTHLMDNFETQGIASTANVLQLERGKTFAFVSGLGGRSVKGHFDALAANPWWASVYTSAQGANFGALFCEFNKDGDENKAHCYFKDIDGFIADEFDLLAPDPVPVVEGPPLPEQQPVTFQEVLDILGPTGVILPLVDSATGGFSAGTFDTVGAEQFTFTWSEPPDAFDIPAGFKGSVPVVTMNGVDEFADTLDADYWSPGDGVNDMPFSVGAWFYQEQLSGGVTVYSLLTKTDLTDGNTSREWSLLADKGPRMRLWDESSSGRQDRFISPLSMPIKGWLHLIATYDGSGSASGVKVYIEGARIDKNTDTGGSYTAMENTDSLVRLGYRQGTAGGDQYLRGKVAGGSLGPFFVHKELTDAEVKSLYELGRKLLQQP